LLTTIVYISVSVEQRVNIVSARRVTSRG